MKKKRKRELDARRKFRVNGSDSGKIWSFAGKIGHNSYAFDHKDLRMVMTESQMTHRMEEIPE